MSDCPQILILDPSPIFRSTLKEVIQSSYPQADVAEAADSDQAKGILKRQPVDVIFLDIAFPGNNGIAFINEIKKLTPDGRIVVLSSLDSAEYRNASMQSGADHFLSKERSNGIQLLDVIHATLASKSSTREHLARPDADR